MYAANIQHGMRHLSAANLKELRREAEFSLASGTRSKAPGKVVSSNWMLDPDAGI
jgi:hypothetical protein